MTSYFISRHPGAIDWVKKQGINIDHQIKHLDLTRIGSNDIVIGTLPINLIAKVCQQGGRYLHLSMELPADARGKELTAKDMTRYNARLEEYRASKIG